MQRVATVVAIGVVAATCSPGPKGPDDQSTRAALTPPAYVAGTESRVMTSSKTGRPYQVSVALPRGYEASSASYPVLYALDANGEFGIVVETARLLQLEGGMSLRLLKFGGGSVDDYAICRSF